MAKKQKKDQSDAFQKFDPAIQELAMKRFLSGKQIFNYKTKRLRPFIRDEIQGRAVVMEAVEIAKKKGVDLRLSSLEKRLLKRLGDALKYTELLGLAFSLCTFWMLMDMDNDGDCDVVAPLIHELQPNDVQY